MAHDDAAQVSITIEASPSSVWNALTDPTMIRRYMFGTTVASAWEVGAAITWSGEWKGQGYQDKGVIREFDPERRMQYTHFSPLSGQPDLPENYHTVTVELQPQGNSTRVTLTQDNNPNEEARDHSQQNWEAMLVALKKVLEA